MPPGPAATLLLADPLTATLLGVLVLGESIPPISALGLLLVLVGLLLQGRALGTTRAEEPAPQPTL
jgi:DME family drug/metabolite transporter